MNLNNLYKKSGKKCQNIFIFNNKKSSRFISSLESSQVRDVLCLDTGGAKAASKVETSIATMMQISKLRIYQKSHEIVSSDKVQQSKEVNNDPFDNLDTQGVNLHGGMIYFNFYTTRGLLCSKWMVTW